MALHYKVARTFPQADPLKTAKGPAPTAWCRYHTSKTQLSKGCATRPDEAKFGNYAQNRLVSDFFSSGGAVSEGLSQLNGFAIWLRPGDWVSGSTSQYFSNGKVNYYGMGTLLHETLHKQVVGAFSHPDMGDALVIPTLIDDNPCVGHSDHNTCSDLMGQRCFPQ